MSNDIYTSRSELFIPIFTKFRKSRNAILVGYGYCNIIFFIQVMTDELCLLLG